MSAGTKYIHFTDLSGAKAIKASGKLMASSFITGVYAVKEGSPYIPEVQQTTLGRARNRKVAVVFTTPVEPSYCYPEECVWRADDIPVEVERVMLAQQAVKEFLKVSKTAKTPHAIGLPGGPCHIIRDIESENLPEGVKQDLIEDVERGRDLSNSEADMIYPPQRLKADSKLFQKIFLTSHAQYRMNLRGVTIRELQGVFVEFDKWYQARVKAPDKLNSEQKQLMTDLAYGKAARFSGARSGLTVVFAVDSKRREARLVSCWWTNSPKTPKPTPGQCEFVPYLDRDRTFERPAILGSVLNDTAYRVAFRVWVESRKAGKSQSENKEDSVHRVASKVAAKVYAQKYASDNVFGWSPEEIARRRELILQRRRDRPTTPEDVLDEQEISAIQTLLRISRNNLDPHKASDVLARKGLKSREVQSILSEVTSDAAIFEVTTGKMHHDLKRHERTWDKLCKAADFDWKRAYQRTLENMS